MPHLQFDINIRLSEEDRTEFCEFVKVQFGKIMKTGTDHIAVTLREYEKGSLSLGRAKKNESVCLMNLDLREGRSDKQKRDLVDAYMNEVSKKFGVSVANQYVTFTSHTGADFHLYERSLTNWKKNDDPLK